MATSQGSNLRTRLEGINRLLERIYERPRLLSDILIDGGFALEDITTIRSKHLERYLESLTTQWTAWMTATLSPRYAGTIVHRYSLHGLAPATLVEVGSLYGVSRERIRQLPEKAIRRLRNRRRQQALEAIVLQAAKQILDSDAGQDQPSLHIPQG